MSEFHVSSALIVPADTTVSECVRKMRDHKAGSILVSSYTYPYELLGIFTERDLLKWIDEIQGGNHWEKAVSTIMTKNPKTISLLELDRAAEIMLENHFRHLPIVYEEGGMTHIAGVISMRDLFSDLVKKTTGKPAAHPTSTSAHKKTKIALLARDDSAFKAAESVFSQGHEVNIKRLTLEEASDPAMDFKAYRLLGVDVDRFGPDIWAECLRVLNKNDSVVHVLIVYNPVLHSPKSVEYLRILSGSEKFTTYAKPFNVLEVMKTVGKWTRNL